MAEDRNYSLPPTEGIVLTHFLTVSDVARSVGFYRDVLGGRVIRDGQPSIVQLANSWIIVNVGGGPTDDKPEVTLHTPDNPNEATSFMNIRVADIRACYGDWTRKGAIFLTEPKVHTHEIRCYMRDPDGYLIEVGQSTAGG
jgi:lactoylglutathione lyase